MVNTEVMTVHRCLGLSECVDIDKNGEVVEFVVTREGRGLPNAALCDFSVARNAVNVVVDFVIVLA